MATVRRHWAWITALPTLLLSLLFALLQNGGDIKAHADAAAGPPQTAVQVITTTQSNASDQDLQEFNRIRALRTELALNNADLAALGLSAPISQQIFTAVKTFSTSSINALGVADKNYQLARNSLQEAVRAINVGTGDNTALTSLSTLKQNVDTAATQRDSVIAPLLAQINGLLTADQQTMWQAARTNAVLSRTPGHLSVPGMYRYAGNLTADQIQQLHKAARRGGGSSLDTAANQILSGTQLATIQTVSRNQKVNTAAVAAAEHAVLPQPSLSTAVPTTMPTSGSSSPPQ